MTRNEPIGEVEATSIFYPPEAVSLHQELLTESPYLSDTVDPNCGLIVSIEDPQKNPEAYRLKVYPNPASGKITVEIPEYLQKQTGPAEFQVTTVYHQWGSATLEVYDLFGRKVMERTIYQGAGNVDVDVSQWQGGMYVFRLSYRGETVATEKVVVEN